MLDRKVWYALSLLTPDLDFIIISSCSQQRSTGMNCNTSHRSYQEHKDEKPPFQPTITNLRVPQTYPLIHPCDSSTIEHYHCAGRQLTRVGLDGMQDLNHDWLFRHDILKKCQKSDTLHAIAFRFEFSEHYRHPRNVSWGSSARWDIK